MGSGWGWKEVEQVQEANNKWPTFEAIQISN